MISKSFSLILFFTACSAIVGAQDVPFAMPYSAPLNLNPSFAGSTGCATASAVYHKEFIGFPGSPLSSYISYDQYVNQLKGGLGIEFSREALGNFGAYHLGGIYSAHIPLFKNKWVFSPSVEAAYGQKSVDNNWLSPSPAFRNSYFDLSSGILVYSKNLYGGLAMNHINMPRTDAYNFPIESPIKYKIQIGGNIGNVHAEKSWTISPSLLVVRQQDFGTVSMRCAVKYDKYSIGIGYGNSDNMILSAGFRSKYFHVAYSYEWITSRLDFVTGSHEIALFFLFNCKHVSEGFLPFDTAAF